MNLSFIKEKVTNVFDKIGENIMDELNNYIKNNQMTSDSKKKLQNEKNEILRRYEKIGEVKDRGVYVYSNENKNPEFNRELYNGEKNGFYLIKDNKLVFDEKLNDDIVTKINLAKSKIINEQNKALENYRKIGEEYTVTELADDDKYMYLRRKSDGVEFQDFNLSDELYEEIKKRNIIKQDTTLIWNGQEYDIK